MGSRQIVLVSTAGFSVLNTGIFWQDAKTKRLFSQCGSFAPPQFPAGGSSTFPPSTSASPLSPADRSSESPPSPAGGSSASPLSSAGAVACLAELMTCLALQVTLFTGKDTCSAPPVAPPAGLASSPARLIAFPAGLLLHPALLPALPGL